MKALLVIDMLEDFIDLDGKLSTGSEGLKIVPFVKNKLDTFRADGDKIIYICDNHERDDREFEMFPVHCVAGTKGSNIIKDLEPLPGEKIIYKRRYSSFFATELDLYLRENSIDELYIVGVCTNICVLYTCADGRNLNYNISVYKDGVASFDKEAHEFALKEIGTSLGCKVL